MKENQTTTGSMPPVGETANWVDENREEETFRDVVFKNPIVYRGMKEGRSLQQIIIALHENQEALISLMSRRPNERLLIVRDPGKEIDANESRPTVDD